MTWNMKGDYVKNCNCAPTCGCDTTGWPSPNKNCEGLIAMRVNQGHFDDVKLDGSKWAVTVYWPGALHEGNGTAEIFVDKSATQEQRDALMKILSGQNGGPLFEIFSQIVTTFHGPHFVDIEFEFDRDKRRSKVRVPEFFDTESEPLIIPANGEEQRVIVKLPGGFEYKEMDVAQTKKLTGTGAIKFDHKGTHSSLANIEHTNEGLVA